MISKFFRSILKWLKYLLCFILLLVSCILYETAYSRFHTKLYYPDKFPNENEEAILLFNKKRDKTLTPKLLDGNSWARSCLSENKYKYWAILKITEIELSDIFLVDSKNQYSETRIYAKPLTSYNKIFGGYYIPKHLFKKALAFSVNDTVYTSWIDVRTDNYCILILNEIRFPEENELN